MSVTEAFRDGLRRVRAAPAILVGLFAVTYGFVLPLAAALREMLRAHLGESLAATTAATGVNYDWWLEFSEQATGIGTTFQPTIIGFAAVLSNLSRFLDNEALPTAMASAVAAYLIVWSFLVGGILDRYARGRATRAHGFFAACGTFFFRFVRLGIFAGITYGILFGPVHRWLLSDVYRSVTHDMTVEREAFAVRLVLYALFGAALVACNLAFDYAKVRAVVEDRHSMVGAVLAGIRFVARRRLRVLGLYLLGATLFGSVLLVYALLAPGAGGMGASMWIGFAIGQIYILARLCTKLVFLASETAFFQAELAHAEYSASPLPTWPESPAAEAIGNARR